jgi:hypothetical protein
MPICWNAKEKPVAILFNDTARNDTHHDEAKMQHILKDDKKCTK